MIILSGSGGIRPEIILWKVDKSDGFGLEKVWTKKLGRKSAGVGRFRMMGQKLYAFSDPVSMHNECSVHVQDI